MSDVKKIATRESYGNALAELGKEHEDIVVLDADLAAATKTGVFKKAFPERHIDCGIAESNMMGVAAGIATTGKVPFASSFAMFAAGRAFEQVRNSIGYPKLNVKIGATHAGISVGEDGATHQCNEDIALMRTIPGMVVINPSDDVEAKAAVKAAYEHVGPVYLRFGRLAVPVINDNEDYKFELGKAITLREGTDVAIIASGLTVSESLAAAEKLAADGIRAEVINMHTIKPLDEDAIVKAAKKTGKIVTVEEHSVIGGLGSAVCDVVAEKAPAKVMKIGINDVFGESGPAVQLIQKYGLDSESIYEKIKEFLK
ncbi:MAG: transketolase family protein [Dorea sp.]|jgi:transketolase|nr:transketolase family protein [Dorea sp.]MCI9455255.1 transketolase family protein [Dorea sp.]